MASSSPQPGASGGAREVPTAAPAGGRARGRRRRRAALLAGSDAVMLGLAVGVSAVAGGAHVATAGWTAVYVVLTLVFLLARGSYRTRLRASVFDHVTEVLVATAVAASAVVTARVVLENDTYAAAQTVRLWGFAGVYLFAGRIGFNIAMHSGRRRGLATVIVGAGVVGQSIARRLLDRPEMGLQPIGFLDGDPRALEAGLPPLLGNLDALERILAERDVDQVIITFSLDSTAAVLQVIRLAREHDVDVAIVPRFFEEVSRRISVEHLGGVALLRVARVDPQGWQFELKYALDRVVAAAIILLLLPLFAVVALSVRLSSPGPIVFRQQRLGRDGHRFDMLKFRTMHVGPPGVENDAAWAARVLGSDEGDPADAPATGDRITPVGRVLRRFSLDEILQLFNVLRGDMSLVGPRPERLSYAEVFGSHVYRYDDRHRVKSGLTGWAQVQGLRGETSLTDRIEWDNYYVENWTPWLDLKILFLTPIAVVSHGGSGA